MENVLVVQLPQDVSSGRVCVNHVGDDDDDDDDNDANDWSPSVFARLPVPASPPTPPPPLLGPPLLEDAPWGPPPPPPPAIADVAAFKRPVGGCREPLPPPNITAGVMGCECEESGLMWRIDRVRLRVS